MLHKSSLDKIWRDWGETKNNDNSSSEYNFYEIERFFYLPEGQIRADLANNAGALYMQEFTDFVTSALYPADGSWLQAVVDENDEPEVMMGLDMVSDHVRNKLSESNFYGKMNELVAHGLLYNKGLLSVDYTEGLNFSVHNPKNTWATDNTDDYSRRVYSERKLRLSDLDAYFSNVPQRYKDLMAEGLDMYELTVMHAIVPCDDQWAKGIDKDAGAKFVRLSFLLSVEGHPLYPLKPKEGMKYPTYTTSPLLQYNTGQRMSLCRRALPDADIANRYEQAMLERSELANYPPMAIPLDLENRKGYSMQPGGIVPIKPGETAPTPVATTIDLNVSERTVARKEARLREIFKIDLIKQAQLTGMSQYEHNALKYTALKAIQPLVCTLTSKTTSTMVERIHKLLKKHDPQYRLLMSELPSETQGLFHFDNLKRLMEQSKVLANLGRAAQAIQGYASFDPQALQRVDSTGAVVTALEASQLPHLIKDEAEAAAEAEAYNQEAAGQEQQAMALEQQKLAPSMMQAETDRVKAQDEMTKRK